MLKGKKLAVIGGGKMGEVIISGIISQKLLPGRDITVTDKIKKRLQELKESYGVSITDKNSRAVKSADVIILAMKPHRIL